MAKKDKQKFESVAWLKHYRYWIVFAFSFLLYANTVPNFYAMDDELVTTTNSQSPHRLTSKGIAAIPEIFTEPYYKDNQGYAFDYRPIVLVFFTIEHSLFGDNPHVSHFFNVLLYALLCVLLLKVLEALLKNYNPLLALVATLLFAAHPVHTEVVASIKNRDEILALLFMLLACFAYFKTAEKIPNKWLYYLLFVTASIFSILSKPTAIAMLPIIILFVIVHHKLKLLPLLLLSLLPLIVFAITQSTPIPLSWFLILVAAIWFVTILFYWVCHVPETKLKLQLHKQKLFLEGNKVRTQVGKSNFISISNRATLLSISFLVVLTALLIFFEVPNSYFIIYFTIPLILNFRAHKHYELILFLEFTFLSISGIVFNVSEHNLLILSLLYTLSRRETKLNLIYGVYIVGIAIVSYYFTQITIGFLLFSVFLYLIMLFNTKLIRYISIVFFLIIPTIVLIVIKKDFTVYEFREIAFFILTAYTVPFVAMLYIIGIKKRNIVWSCVFILAVGSFNTYAPKQLYNKSKFVYQAEKIVNKKLPQLIEQNVYDRPITYLEAVTDALSPMEYKLGTAAQVLKKYASLLVVPYPLSFYYGYKIIDHQSGFEPLNILVLAAYLLLGIIGLLLLRKQRIIAISILIMVIGISIYTNVFLAAPGMMADRFLFVPSIGFCLLLAYAILSICKVDVNETTTELNLQKINQNVKYSVLAVLLVYSGLTIARNADWKNSLTLFGTDIKHLENSAQANNLYALELMSQSFLVDSSTARQMRLTAEYHFKKSIEIYPKYFNTQYDLARTQSVLGKSAEAELNFVKAAKMNSEFPSAWLQAIDIAISRQHYANAIQYFSSMPQNNFNQNSSAILKLGYVYFLNKQYDSSLATLRNGAVLFPQQADFSWAMGEVFMSLSKKDSAIFYYEKSLGLNPANAQLRQLILNLRENRIK